MSKLVSTKICTQLSNLTQYPITHAEHHTVSALPLGLFPFIDATPKKVPSKTLSGAVIKIQ